QTSGNLLARKRSRLKPTFNGMVLLGTLKSQPDRLEVLGIVVPAWKKVPVQMRDLISQCLVIHFSRPKAKVNCLGQEAHFVQIGLPYRVGKLKKLAGVRARD